VNSATPSIAPLGAQLTISKNARRTRH